MKDDENAKVGLLDGSRVIMCHLYCLYRRLRTIDQINKRLSNDGRAVRSKKETTNTFKSIYKGMRG